MKEKFANNGKSKTENHKKKVFDQGPNWNERQDKKRKGRMALNLKKYKSIKIKKQKTL